MSDEQLYGQEEREQSAGYAPMPLANPIPKEEFDDTSSSALDDKYSGLTPEEAAALRNEQRMRPEESGEPVVTEQPPIPVKYTQQVGENTGQPMPENQTVSPEQAAHDLASWRETVGQTLQDAQDAELQKVIDQLRAGDQQQPVAEQQPQAQPEVPQPQAASGDDEVQRALSSPKVLAAIEAQVGQYQQAAQQAQQQYENAVLENTKMALAGLVSNFQELAGVPADGLATAIQMIHRTSPERGKAISNYLQNVSSLLQNGAQVVERQRLAQEQQTQARMHQYATQMQEQFNREAAWADSQFSDYAKSEGLTAAQLKDIKNEAMEILRESGMTDQDIAIAYNTDKTLRSFVGQVSLMNNARWRIAQRNLAKNIAPKPVPPVQRPGSLGERASERDYQLHGLNEKLNKSGSWKDAAELLNARRARR